MVCFSVVRCGFSCDNSQWVKDIRKLWMFNFQVILCGPDEKNNRLSAWHWCKFCSRSLLRNLHCTSGRFSVHCVWWHCCFIGNTLSWTFNCLDKTVTVCHTIQHEKAFVPQNEIAVWNLMTYNYTKLECSRFIYKQLNNNEWSLQ